MSINHQEKVTNFVAKMLEDDFYHDVTIVCDNGEVKANKVILCASSNHFSGVFNNNIIKSEDATSTFLVPSTKESMELVIKCQVFAHRQNGVQGAVIEGDFGSPQASRITGGGKLVLCS